LYRTAPDYSQTVRDIDRINEGSEDVTFDRQTRDTFQLYRTAPDYSQTVRDIDRINETSFINTSLFLL